MVSDRDRRGGRRGPYDRSGRPPSGYEDEEEGPFGEDDEFEEEPAPERQRGGRPAVPPGRGPRAGRAAGGRGRPHSGGGGRGRPQRGRDVDWAAIEDEETDEPDAREGGGAGEFFEEDEDAAPRRRPARREERRRLSLMDLCTPVFGYAAILPREAGGIHPGYQQFRQEVLSALERIESEARDQGIDVEDAREATYALSLFLDEQVAQSEWSGKVQWAGEPLNTVRVNDPEGGVNFFNHLERLGERQRAVKRVYLVCLAFGFRGKFAELEPAQQVARIGEIKQKVLRSTQDPLERQRVLFPEAYEPAVPLEDPAPPAPRAWWIASLGAVFLLFVLWLVLFMSAGSISAPAAQRMKGLLDHGGARGEPAPDPSGDEPRSGEAS